MNTQVKTSSLSLYKYNPDSQVHKDFVELMTSEDSLADQVGDVKKKLKEFSMLSLPGQLWNGAFLVGNEDELVGYVYLFRHSFSTRIAMMNYAVTQNLRGQGYGKMLVKEISDYIFFSQKVIDNIILIINSNNVNSIGAAEFGGFTKEGGFYVKSRGV